jgi:hypothetical protein
MRRAPVAPPGNSSCRTSPSRRVASSSFTSLPAGTWSCAEERRERQYPEVRALATLASQVSTQHLPSRTMMVG